MSLWLVAVSQRRMPLGACCEGTSMSSGIGVCTRCSSFRIPGKTTPFISSVARGRDPAWLHDVARRVAKGVSLIGDHRGDLEVGELLLPRRHGRVLLAAVHDDVDVARERSGGNRTVSDGGIFARQTLAVRLMTGRATARVHLPALGLQLIAGVRLSRRGHCS